MDEAILRAAKHVYDHLDDDVDISVEYDLLQEVCEEDSPNCASFVIDLSLVSVRFSDSEMTDSEGISESQIDDTARIKYMREKLKTSLDDWSEEHPSLSIHEFHIDANVTLFFCGVVDGYTSEIKWLPPSRSIEEVHEKTAALGFLSDNEEIEALTDSGLLSLWR